MGVCRACGCPRPRCFMRARPQPRWQLRSAQLQPCRPLRSPLSICVCRRPNGNVWPKPAALHHQEGKDIAAKTLEVLKKYGYTGKDDKVYLQCFDADELKRIKKELEPKMGMDLNLVQLIAYTDWNETQQKQPDGSWINYNYDWMFKPGAMKQVAEYADGIGPDYHMLIEETSQPGNIKLTGMVQDAQQNKLAVHPYTVRSDKLPEYTTDVNQLYDALYNKAGVNGLFTDFPDKAVKFLNKE